VPEHQNAIAVKAIDKAAPNHPFQLKRQQNPGGR
jgi:hypothetical protein